MVNAYPHSVNLRHESHVRCHASSCRHVSQGRIPWVIRTVVILEEALGDGYEPPLLKWDAVVIWEDTVRRRRWRAS